ncbi:cyclophilin-like fold protein [Companilactobacillus kimchii]|uniref:Cyclophilin-like domain-containing protein n=2 Tax=Companilactobacillus kimchii TaxID=2801452 RepID=A0ABR5NT24_9LACO|nr:cyclophilin-like fold protein [Companilactobacillus kimchii]KAE9562119.1 hypothetical protein ATN91_05890 [Companilactobacillus kimchii]KRK51265.1 hypothetical protein FC97_GL000957 [Companilactobacillus kimchii DSM 13961 = JCM 10707]OWF34253.1 hypothetical protein LKACC12383_00166 [Companilactobacillus kimchii]GEO46167.1 hypothetical protein LKI01_01660 [Companilactobacillus paralimentarius]
MTKVKLIINNQELTADFDDNDTSRAIMAQFPLKVSMMNLYSREMTYRFKTALPAKKAKTSGYEVGDIAYWAPRHSFVIFYKQTGEVIGDLQKIGHIKDDISFFNQLGDADIEFSIE